MLKFKNIKVPRMKGGKKVGTRLQRVQVLKSGKLKFVKNQPRGGGRSKSAAKKPAKKRSRSVAKKSNPGNKSPKIGAAIQAFKGTQAVFSPAIDVAAGRPASAQAAINDLKQRDPVNYGASLVGEGINQAIDRKLAHASALSGGSVTAWFAEGYAGAELFDRASGSSNALDAVQGVNRRMSRMVRAYDPQSGKIVLSDPRFRLYQGLKVGGGLLRRVSNMGPFKKIFAPAKKLLSSFGGRL